MQSIGRMIVILGVILLVAGGVMMLLGKSGVRSLPGDVEVRRGNWTFFFPLGTSILLSVILSILLTLLARRR